MISKSIAIQPSNSLPPSKRSVEMDTAFQIVVILVIISTIGTLICAGIPKVRQHSFSFNPSPKVPCRRCRYFSDNHFLKCTRHPATVLTGQAVDCRDYCPHSVEKRMEEESTARWNSLSWRRIIQNFFHK